MELTELINGLVIADKHCTLSLEPYKNFSINSEGLEIIRSDIKQTEKILGGFYRMIEDLRKINWGSLGDDPHIPDHILQETYSFYISAKNKCLGSGAEGTAYQFFYPEKTIAVKFYNNLFINHDCKGGVAQFTALTNTPKETRFITPQPYFATEFLCAAEDFSPFQDYFAFIKQHPSEEKKLEDYLTELAKNDPLDADLGDIFWNKMLGISREKIEKDREDMLEEFKDCREDMPDSLFREEKSSVFIVEYNPKCVKNEERYRLATVDIGLKELKK